MAPSFARLGFIEFSVTNGERSANWYREVFGLETVRERRRQGRLDAVILRHEASGVSIGLVQHEANDGRPFSEFRTGLDQLEFTVRDREDLESGAQGLTISA